MKLTGTAALFATATAALNPAVVGRRDAKCRPDICTPKYHAQIISNYLKLWGGDLEVLNQTISPSLLFQADRFPASASCGSGLGSVTFSINSSAEFGELVQNARMGFLEYGFDSDFWFANENRVVLRWSLDAIVGNYTRYPT
jgi:hypothetical protein